MARQSASRVRAALHWHSAYADSPDFGHLSERSTRMNPNGIIHWGRDSRSRRHWAVLMDVLVPWSAVLARRCRRGNALFAENQYSETQPGIRPAIRPPGQNAQFLPAWRALTRTVKTEGFLQVQEQLGELLGYFFFFSFFQLIDGAILLYERRRNHQSRTVRPLRAVGGASISDPPLLRAPLVTAPQVLGAGGLLINPTQADVQVETSHQTFRAITAGPRRSGRAHTPVHARWMRTGTQFGPAQAPVWRYYAGDPGAHSSPRST